MGSETPRPGQPSRPGEAPGARGSSPAGAPVASGAAPQAVAAAPAAFAAAPHQAFLGLTLPVLGSLVAEPLTGLVDTAFVARLGVGPEAALGAATALISSLLWAFNFLSIGTQTEVAAAVGRGEAVAGRRMATLAVALGAVLGCLLLAAGWPQAERLALAMGTRGDTAAGAARYLELRLLGAPAVLATIASLGALRGLQAMRETLWIALGTNAINLVLDPLLIFGWGPVPAYGLAGAAAASTVAQWLGAAAAIVIVGRRLGFARDVAWRDASRLFAIGRDLFVRTAMLVLFTTLLTTRAANQVGAEAGAAHIAIRQFWGLAAFLLDAYAHAAQTLVGQALAAGERALARRAIAISTGWSFGTGIAIAVAMLVAAPWAAALLVPPAAHAAFFAAWPVAAIFQPVNAIAFNTDGVHWGTSDYRFLRNAMLVSSGVGIAGLAALEASGRQSLEAVWWVAGLWITLRAAFGAGRIWPGAQRAPMGRWRGAAGPENP